MLLAVLLFPVLPVLKDRKGLAVPLALLAQLACRARAACVAPKAFKAILVLRD